MKRDFRCFKEWVLVKVVSWKCGCQVSGISGHVRPVFPCMSGVNPFKEVHGLSKTPSHVLIYTEARAKLTTYPRWDNKASGQFLS